MIDIMEEESESILSVQWLERSDVAELRWNSASELIRVEHPERATMNEWEHVEIDIKIIWR